MDSRIFPVFSFFSGRPSAAGYFRKKQKLTPCGICRLCAILRYYIGCIEPSGMAGEGRDGMEELIPENSTLARRIRAAASKGTLSHAAILSGSGDRMAAARYFAAALECEGEGERPCLRCRQCRKVLEDIHPDVVTVRDDGHKELPVELVRQLRQDVYIRPNDGARKVYIFADCGQLNQRDQNVLLKIVEEGPAYAAFLFCAETAAALLPTVRSRCVEWKVAGQPETPEMEQARGLCRVLAQGKTLPAAQWLVSLENRRIKREQLQELLQDAWLLTAQALLLQAGKPKDGTLPEEAELLSRSLSSRRLEGLSALLRQYSAECAYNVGAGHVLGALCAQWERLLHATR